MGLKKKKSSRITQVVQVCRVFAPTVSALRPPCGSACLFLLVTVSPTVSFSKPPVIAPVASSDVFPCFSWSVLSDFFSVSCAVLFFLPPSASPRFILFMAITEIFVKGTSDSCHSPCCLKRMKVLATPGSSFLFCIPSAKLSVHLTCF